MKTFLNKKNITLILIGFLIVFFIIFFKVFYKRIPRDLYLNLSIPIILLYICTLSLFLFSIINCIYNILIYYRIIIPKENSYFSNLLKNNKILVLCKSIINYYNESLKSFDYFIKIYIFDISKITLYISKKILNHIKYFQIKYLTWIFDFLPKIIGVICFSIDVVWFHKFYYSYIITPILIIPIIYSYLLYNMKFICSVNVGRADDVFLFYDRKKEKYILIHDYVHTKHVEAYSNFEKELYIRFSDEYLLNDNLSLYRFGWTENYIEKNKELLSRLNDNEINDRFFGEYLGLHQIFILLYIYIAKLGSEREIHSYHIRLIISIIFLIDWIYIITYGFQL